MTRLQRQQRFRARLVSRPQRLPISAFKERDVQRRFLALLTGKMIGLFGAAAAVGLAFFLFESAVGAAPMEDVPSAVDLINPLNTVWVLVAAFLVFFMQAGFMALEAGFARSKESVNVMMECIFDTCLCGILYWAIGFAFEFGVGNGLIGHSFFFLHHNTADYRGTGVAFYAFVLFQFAFADTASTITSGAMVGRTSFKGDILYSLGVSGIIYPITCHWIWARADGSGTPWGGSTGWSPMASCSVTSPARLPCTPLVPSSPSSAQRLSVLASAARSLEMAAVHSPLTT
ncbi:MAG: ammonium transporter [Ilumatobacteraceae bacterium]|nr:ammonium transporter [Ilumatobacteraceae bacterium]